MHRDSNRGVDGITFLLYCGTHLTIICKKNKKSFDLTGPVSSVIEQDSQNDMEPYASWQQIDAFYGYDGVGFYSYVFPLRCAACFGTSGSLSRLKIGRFVAVSMQN